MNLKYSYWFWASFKFLNPLLCLNVYSIFCTFIKSALPFFQTDTDAFTSFNSAPFVRSHPPPVPSHISLIYSRQQTVPLARLRWRGTSFRHGGSSPTPASESVAPPLGPTRLAKGTTTCLKHPFSNAFLDPFEVPCGGEDLVCFRKGLSGAVWGYELRGRNSSVRRMWSYFQRWDAREFGRGERVIFAIMWRRWLRAKLIRTESMIIFMGKKS